MSFIQSLTEEVTDILDVYTDDNGVLDPMNTWDREDLVRFKTLIDYVLIIKKDKGE